MRKAKLLAIIGIAAVGISITAQASSIAYQIYLDATFSDMISFYGSQMLSATGNNPHKTQTGTFDLKTDGKETTTIVKAPGYSDVGKSYSDKSGFTPGSDLATSGVISFYFRDSDTNAETAQVIFPTGDLAQYTAKKKLTFQMFNATADILTTINDKGTLDFAVTATEGDFFFDYARLDIVSTKIPDGATTMMLLGGSLCGLGVLRRKLR